mmetsp:Transcript_86477/g.185313  ORF Transcript_86477/g.185313 Transcript_86477/m.185313 type:complete len:269 (-) Transcript_86477:48-854(-)
MRAMAAATAFSAGICGDRRGGSGSRPSHGSGLSAAPMHLVLAVAMVASLPVAGANGSGLEGTISLSSSFIVGSGNSPAMTCTALTLRSGSKAQGRLFHTFGAGGGGEVWRYSGVAVPLNEATRQGFDLSQPLGLQFRLSANGAESWSQQPSIVHVSGMEGTLPRVMHRETLDKDACPPPFCLVPDPEVDVGTSMPHCGWAPPLPGIAATAPRAQGHVNIDIDITSLAAANYSMLKVWVTPLSLTHAGMWQTPEFTLESIRYYHLDMHI